MVILPLLLGISLTAGEAEAGLVVVDDLAAWWWLEERWMMDV